MRRIWVATAAVFAVAVVADLLLGARRPGLTAALGLFGCLAIILVSKWLGKVLLQREERYYGDDGDG